MAEKLILTQETLEEYFDKSVGVVMNYDDVQPDKQLLKNSVTEIIKQDEDENILSAKITYKNLKLDNEFLSDKDSVVTIESFFDNNKFTDTKIISINKVLEITI